MKKPIFPKRLRSSNGARVTKIRKLIDRLRQSPMDLKDIGPFLGLSDGGVRKYTAEMQLAWIIRQCGSYRPGNGERKTFQLTDDENLLKGYLAAIEPAPPGKRAVLEPTPEPGRHFHAISDDEFQARPLRKVKPVMPDPFALDPAFFKRSVVAEGESA